MALIDPPNNGDDNKENEYSGEKYRNEVINKLSLSKQFTLRQQLSNCDALSRDQAVEFLKDCIIQLAHKDYTLAQVMRPDWM